MEPRSRENTPTKEDLDFIVDDGYNHDEDPTYEPKDSSSSDDDKYVVSGKEFKKLTRKAKKLGAESLDYSTRKNNKYVATCTFKWKENSFRVITVSRLSYPQRPREKREISC